MNTYDIKNRNGSLVFVRGLRVKPYANFSANLDPITARELIKYGVSLTPVLSAQAPAPAPEFKSLPVVEMSIPDSPAPVSLEGVTSSPSASTIEVVEGSPSELSTPTSGIEAPVLDEVLPSEDLLEATVDDVLMSASSPDDTVEFVSEEESLPLVSDSSSPEEVSVSLEASAAPVDSTPSVVDSSESSDIGSSIKKQKKGKKSKAEEA